MSDKIRIEIRFLNTSVNILLGVGTVVMAIWLGLLIKYFSVVGLILFVVVLSSFIALAVASEKLPTVVIADEKELKYKHIFGWKTIELSKINTITCEPYEARGRYSSTQCIRLNITTDSDECDLKQIVNTNKMLIDSMEGKQTDLPLMRLYEFIRVKMGVD